MKIKLPIPWDVAIVLSMALGGFGYSIKKIIETRMVSSNESEQSSSSSQKPHISFFTFKNESDISRIQLGCVDTKKSYRAIAVKNQLIVEGDICHKENIENIHSLLLLNLSTGQSQEMHVNKETGKIENISPLRLQKKQNSIQLQWFDHRQEHYITFIVDNKGS